ncbi:hypothetical protein L3Q67_23795 [Saccharothrix sp. AJ9571]|nr:hypothetical protein L3Q67_23795 [Saccharothrix sp. AJ9571]
MEAAAFAERFPIRLATGRPEAPRLIQRSFTVNTITAGNPLFSHPLADQETDGFAETPGAAYENLFREPGRPVEGELPRQRRTS